MRNLIEILSITILYSTSGIYSLAEDSVRFDLKKPHTVAPNYVEDNIQHFNHKYFLTPFPASEISFLNFFKGAEIYPSRYFFNHCGFYVYQVPYQQTKGAPVTVELQFDSCAIKYLILNDLNASHVSITQSRIDVLTISKSQNDDVDISSNPFLNVLKIQDSKNISLTLNFNEYADTPFVVFYNTSFRALEFIPSYAKSSDTYFSGDTINNLIGWTIINFLDSAHGSEKKKTMHSFRFNHCYIDADFMNFGQYYNTTLEFSNCSFGPNANLSSLGVSALRFYNCRTLANNSVPIGFLSDSDQVKLTTVNTDLTNFRINLAVNIILTFDSATKKDICFNTYESLLNKFRAEGKHDSYKTVDIQYKKFKNSALFNWIDKTWWNYGYDKSRVIWWMIFFIIGFTIVNFIFWNPVRSAYPKIPEEKSNYYSRSVALSGVKFLIKKLFIVFVFTSLLFFSVSLSFDKLSYRRLLPLFWILLQYATGLICLFFAMNYIFKL